VRRKIEQRNALLAQAEVRETRTRRQTQKPDYVYGNDLDSEASPEEFLNFSTRRSADLLFLEPRMMPTSILTKRTTGMMNLRMTTSSIFEVMCRMDQATVVLLRPQDVDVQLGMLH